MYIFKLKLSEKAWGYCMYVFLVLTVVIQHRYVSMTSRTALIIQKTGLKTPILWKRIAPRLSTIRATCCHLLRIFLYDTGHHVGVPYECNV